MGNASAIAKPLMGIFWILAVWVGVMMAYFLTRGAHGLNSFARPWGLVDTGALSIPVLICGGLRLWLHWLRHPWAVLVVYSIGLFFALDESLQGIYLAPDWCLVFQAASAVLFALYFPWLVR